MPKILRTTCIICNEELKNEEEIHDGVCADCDEKLARQVETGRCSQCGNPVEECDCDDDF